jgi:hypothetical protein
MFIFVLVSCYLSLVSNIFPRLVSSSAFIAKSASFHPPGPVDSITCTNLTHFGDHLLAEERKIALESGYQPSLLARVPAQFKKTLSLAYAHLHLVDDQALTLSALNGTSPFDYLDESKIDRAMLFSRTYPQWPESEFNLTDLSWEILIAL